MLKLIFSHIIDIIALLFIAVLLRSNFMLNDHRKKPFVFGIVITIFVIIAEAGTIIFAREQMNLRLLNIISNVIGFTLTPIIPIIIITIFDADNLKKNRIMLLPAMINCIIAALSPVFGLIFYIDRYNNYVRGSLFYVFVIVYITEIVILLIAFLRSSKNQLYPIRERVLLLALFTVAGTFIQLIFPSVFSSWHIVSLTMLLLYVLLSEFDSSFDTLTGFHNRAAFDKASGEFTDKSRFSVIVTDINDFKEINDTYGHEYGDIVLKKVAAVVKTYFYDSCTCFRVGGDEFYIICRHVDKKKLDIKLAEMTTALANENLDGRQLPELAYGYSSHAGSGPLDFQEILRNADIEMYSCKRMQKHNFEKYCEMPGVTL